MEGGLNFFLTNSGGMNLALVSRAKLKLEPTLRLKLNVLPCLVSTWQMSKHCVTREDSILLTEGVMFPGKSYIHKLESKTKVSDASCSILF